MGQLMELDLKKISLREINNTLQSLDVSQEDQNFTITNPEGCHALCVGIKQEININIEGHVGYYCAGMNQEANIKINGSAGTGVAENMMSGTVSISGNVSQSAGASAHGGLLYVNGDASSRCGISLKGADIVVGGSVGHMSAFMAQSGSLLVCGDAGDALGDSLYEADIYVRGKVKSLGVDCIEKEIRKKDTDKIMDLLSKCKIEDINPDEFKRFGSERKLYNFDIDNISNY